jgi:toxin ParE1/3/4
VSARYLIRPKADRDLEEEAYYLATRGSPDLGHRFLIAAHEVFILLASQPNIGWHARLKDPELASLRVFSISGFEKMLVLYRPHHDGVEILRVVHGARNVLALLAREGLD